MKVPPFQLFSDLQQIGASLERHDLSADDRQSLTVKSVKLRQFLNKSKYFEDIDRYSELMGRLCDKTERYELKQLKKKLNSPIKVPL